MTLSDLTDKERNLILAYRIAPEEIRREVDAVLKPYIGQAKLLEAYRQLNDLGKERLIDYADTLVRSGRYKAMDQRQEERV